MDSIFTVTLCQYILLVLIRVYSSVEPKFCDRYSLFVKCIGTLSNGFTRFEQPTAALVGAVRQSKLGDDTGVAFWLKTSF